MLRTLSFYAVSLFALVSVVSAFGSPRDAQVYDALNVAAIPIPTAAGHSAYSKSVGGLQCVVQIVLAPPGSPVTPAAYTCDLTEGFQSDPFAIYAAFNASPLPPPPTAVGLSLERKSLGSLFCERRMGYGPTYGNGGVLSAADCHLQ